MEIIFYNSQGHPTAYTEDEVYIYLFSGQPVAYIDDSSVFAYNGRHLGRFEDGWIRDNQGNCVFFTEDSSGVPMKPMKSMKPMRPMNTLLWSQLSGEQFFES